MKAVPRRLLVLGGGPVGTELAQADAPARRRGRAGRALRARARPRGRAAGRGARRGAAARRDRARSSASARRPRGARARTTCSCSTTAASCAATSCSSPPAGARACDGIGLETVGITPNPRGVEVDSHLRAGERLWAIGDVTGIFPLTHVGKYQGADRRREHPRRAARGALRGGAARDLHRPAGRGGRRHRGAVQRDHAARGRRQDRDLHARLRRVQRLPHAAQRRRAR